MESTELNNLMSFADYIEKRLSIRSTNVSSYFDSLLDNHVLCAAAAPPSIDPDFNAYGISQGGKLLNAFVEAGGKLPPNESPMTYKMCTLCKIDFTPLWHFDEHKHMICDGCFNKKQNAILADATKSLENVLQKIKLEEDALESEFKLQQEIAMKNDAIRAASQAKALAKPRKPKLDANKLAAIERLQLALKAKETKDPSLLLDVTVSLKGATHDMLGEAHELKKESNWRQMFKDLKEAASSMNTEVETLIMRMAYKQGLQRHAGGWNSIASVAKSIHVIEIAASKGKPNLQKVGNSSNDLKKETNRTETK